MILIDFNQIMIANIMSQIGSHTNVEIEEGLVRHMVLNTIRHIRQKFVDCGELVIATDSKKYWRKEIFPYYKAGRKKAREATDINWSAIFDCLNKVRQELKDNFPYRVLTVERAEADDIIATLCFKYGQTFGGSRIVIVSADKDFIQLQQFANVEQYDPIGKKTIKHPNPQHYMMEHILKGDRGDGIPNILSADDCFVTGERQKPLRDTKIQEMIKHRDLVEKDPTIARGYHRNAQLICFDMIPQDVQQAILSEFEKESNKTREKLFNYFIQHKLKTLMESIGEY